MRAFILLTLALLALAGPMLLPACAENVMPPLEPSYLAAAQGRNGTTLAPVAQGHWGQKITFAPTEWPNAWWSAGEGKSWDWSATPTLAFDISNPNSEPINFSVRVDDDPKADGTIHCVTAGGALPPGKSGAFFLDLHASDDSMGTYGMRGGPPTPGREGMTAMSGSGKIAPSHIVAFQIFLHQPPAPRTLIVSNLRLLPSPLAADRYTGIVDAFGQYAKADWPGKVHDAAEFVQRRDAEQKSLAASPALPGRDEYGGWADGPTLPATGFFATTKRDGKWWLVTPSGHLFLSFGINAMNPGMDTMLTNRETMFTQLPAPPDPLAKHFGTFNNVLYGPTKSGKTFDFYAANLDRKYGADYESAWLDTSLARLKSWGFNTVANWSNDRLAAAKKVPCTATLGIGGSHARIASGSDYWGKMHDPFDPQFARDCAASFQEKATRLKSDPWCLGYFIDNELSWGGGSGPDGGRYGLAYGALAAESTSPAKQAFLAQLRAKYQTIDKLNAAWGTTLANWDALSASYTASKTPNPTLTADLSAFCLAFAKQYFTVVRDALHKYDAHHLYLGCRFAWRTPEAEQAAAQVCDVVSFNIYEPRVDPKQWTSLAALN
ncbi:MAG: beta-galactosidase, partial [Armatimonadota bacterium]|nr:beta-galactosidase [Armatimonadota bacterium]